MRKAKRTRAGSIDAQDRRDRHLHQARRRWRRQVEHRDGHSVLRSHADALRQARAVRSRREGEGRHRRSISITRWRTPASCSARRWPRRWATRRAWCATAISICRWTKRWCAWRSISAGGRCSSGARRRALNLNRLKAGDFPAQLTVEFLRAFAQEAGLTLHVEVLYSERNAPSHRGGLQGPRPRARAGRPPRSAREGHPEHQGNAVERRDDRRCFRTVFENGYTTTHDRHR